MPFDAVSHYHLTMRRLVNVRVIDALAFNNADIWNSDIEDPPTRYVLPNKALDNEPTNKDRMQS